MSDLTPREHEALERLAEGRACKEIAGDMGISTRTVKTHLQRIYLKLKVHKATEAVALFFRSKYAICPTTQPAHE